MWRIKNSIIKSIIIFGNLQKTQKTKSNFKRNALNKKEKHNEIKMKSNKKFQYINISIFFQMYILKKNMYFFHLKIGKWLFERQLAIKFISLNFCIKS